MNYNTKYKYTPLDIATYIIGENLHYSEQKQIIRNVFTDLNNGISAKYRGNYKLFRAAVCDILARDMLYADEYNEAELIMSELGGNFDSASYDDVFGCYFKLIKLQLLYGNIGYRKVKLRTLLRDFGYQRRTASLVKSIENALNALGLVTYLRDYEKCSVGTIELDDMVMIRLE